jgi:glycerophosphoryl diester phosphodiesterase
MSGVKRRLASFRHSLVTRKKLEATYGAGLLVVPRTANAPTDRDMLIDTGVDAVITDDPARLIAYLKERGHC